MVSQPVGSVLLKPSTLVSVTWRYSMFSYFILLFCFMFDDNLLCSFYVGYFVLFLVFITIFFGYSTYTFRSYT